MLDGEDLPSIKVDLESVLVPIGKSIVDAQLRRDLWGRRVCKGILCIASIYLHVESS
jgi:hypothetical protein